MRIVGMISQKGGSGKTTTGIHLAVAATQRGKRVAMIDLDKQKTLTNWHQRRQGTDEPLLATCSVRELDKYIKEARRAAIDLLVIDTPPHAEETIVDAARVCDLVVIPCQPTMPDLDAIVASVEIAAGVHRRAAVVLTRCPPRRKIAALGGGDREAAIVSEIRGVIEHKYRMTVVPGQITNLTSYQYALMSGTAVVEFEPGGKAAEEINSLLDWIEQEVSK